MQELGAFLGVAVFQDKQHQRQMGQEHRVVQREDPQDPAGVEGPKVDPAVGLFFANEQGRDQKTAQHKKQVHALVPAMRERGFHAKPGGIMEDHHRQDAQGPQAVEEQELLLS